FPTRRSSDLFHWYRGLQSDEEQGREHEYAREPAGQLLALLRCELSHLRRLDGLRVRGSLLGGLPLALATRSQLRHLGPASLPLLVSLLFGPLVGLRLGSPDLPVHGA